MTLGFNFIGGGLSASSTLVVSIITFPTGRFVKPSFYPVYGPSGVLTVSEFLPEMIHFVLEKLRFITDCFISVGKCVNYTVFC